MFPGWLKAVVSGPAEAGCAAGGSRPNGEYSFSGGDAPPYWGMPCGGVPGPAPPAAAAAAAAGCCR
jgi:hypothetical protein